MLLLVTNRVPPDVQQPVGPDATVNEEGAEVEAAAILRDDEMDRVLATVACGGASHGIEMGRLEGV